MIVIGAPGLIDRTQFLTDLCESLIATAQESDKFDRFATRVLGAESDESQRYRLRQQLELQTSGLLGLVARNYPAHPYGYGRMDAFGMLFNEIIGTTIGVPENYRIPNAPVSYPFLWNTPRFSWFQTNGCVNNPLVRNMVEVLGVFGRATVRDDAGKLDFVSTADVQRLHRMWGWLDRLQAPRWPGDVVGAIDAQQARRGAEVYRRENCAKCHGNKPPYPETEPNKFGRRFQQVSMGSLEEVGTDPLMAENFAKRTANTGRLATLFGGKDSVGGADIFAGTVVQFMQSDFQQLKLSPGEINEVTNFVVNQKPTPAHILAYKARDLSGIWATAPYLHNGSVPSLYQLLLPPTSRVKTFSVGSREFDPKHVGFESKLDQRYFEFDTTVPGNSNAGHDYGTQISEQERWDLIEYLKTL